MVNLINGTKLQTSSEEGITEQDLTQPEEEMLTTGEHPVYETRPLLWPSLARPALLIVIAVAIIIVAQQIQLQFPVEIEELVSPALVTSIIGWIGIALLGIGVLRMLFRYLRWRCTVYSITNRRIVRQTGILSKSYVDCSLNRVQTLYLNIPTLGRLLNFGTIRIATAGTDSAEIQWESVRNPREAHRILNETIDRLGNGSV